MFLLCKVYLRCRQTLMKCQLSFLRWILREYNTILVQNYCKNIRKTISICLCWNDHQSQRTWHVFACVATLSYTAFCNNVTLCRLYVDSLFCDVRSSFYAFRHITHSLFTFFVLFKMEMGNFIKWCGKETFIQY